MGTRGVCLELRTLGNLIRRHFEFSSGRREIERATGNNGWIVAFLSDAEERGAEVFQRDIEERFSVTRSTASRVLGLMEQKGFIERHAVERDARLKKLVLTPKGRGLKQVMLEDAARMEELLTAGISREEIGQFLSVIGRMRENLSGGGQQSEGSAQC